MPAKSTLRQWLSAGKTEPTIQALQHLAQSLGDEGLVNGMAHLSGRFKGLQEDRGKGIINDEAYRTELSRIREALLGWISQVPAEVELDTAFLQPEKEPPAPEETKGEPAKNNTSYSGGASPIPWMVGLALLIGAAIVLVGFVPCPTTAQAFTFRLLMALGAAGIATILPGLFNISFRGVKAGSSVGIFVLVYLVNPAQLMENDERCIQPFEFTVSLQPDNSPGLSPQYPELENAVLHIRLDNKWEPADVDANGDADYKSIPGGFKGQRVAARLLAKYWALAQDSVVLAGKSAVLSIAPDGSLEKVEGKVMDGSTGNPLSGAMAEIQGITAHSDDQGNFTVRIPLPKQTTDYIVDITLEGYQPYRGNATPATGAMMRVLLDK